MPSRFAAAAPGRPSADPARGEESGDDVTLAFSALLDIGLFPCASFSAGINLGLAARGKSFKEG